MEVHTLKIHRQEPHGDTVEIHVVPVDALVTIEILDGGRHTLEFRLWASDGDIQLRPGTARVTALELGEPEILDADVHVPGKHLVAKRVEIGDGEIRMDPVRKPARTPAPVKGPAVAAIGPDLNAIADLPLGAELTVAEHAKLVKLPGGGYRVEAA